MDVVTGGPTNRAGAAQWTTTTRSTGLHAEKNQAIAKLIARMLPDTGQPILVGTVSIEKSEQLSEC